MKEIFPTTILQGQEMGEPIDPDFSVMPDYPTPYPPIIDEIDPDFSVIPDNSIRPDYPVPPYPLPLPPYPMPLPPYPMPNPPCLFCSNNQWATGSIRMLNGAAGYNPFTIFIDNQPAYFGFGFAEVTSYRRLTVGYHVFTVRAQNGYVYLRKSMYINDGMATLAIVNAPGGLDLTMISDSACASGYGYTCFRVCNLAYYSGSVNVSMANLIFNALGVGQAASFSKINSGNYDVTVSRSVRPAIPLVTMNVNLSSNRIYTLYVLNWNKSADAVRTLLVEDRRG